MDDEDTIRQFLLWMETNDRVDQIAGDAFERADQSRTTAMQTSSRSLLAALAGLILLLLVTACGGEDAAAGQRCVDEARNAAEAAVVADYYERGKLGPKSGDPPAAESRRPRVLYGELSDEEQTFLALWFNERRPRRLPHLRRSSESARRPRARLLNACPFGT